MILRKSNNDMNYFHVLITKTRVALTSSMYAGRKNAQWQDHAPNIIPCINKEGSSSTDSIKFNIFHQAIIKLRLQTIHKRRNLADTAFH
jgi:hypothetical protein